MPQTVYFPTSDFRIEHKLTKKPMSFMHHHSTYEIFYVISGEREYFIEKEFFLAKEGDFVLVPKNMLHRTAGKGADRIVIYFSDSFLETYFSKALIDSLLSGFAPKIFHPNEDGAKKSRALLFTLLSAASSQQKETILASYLFQLLFLLNSEENLAKNASKNSRLQEILKYINQNYTMISGIDQIADHFYISKYHLCRTFTKEMGMTLIDYLNTVKIRAACDMIRQKKCNMTEIALGCGFNSSAYFCKVFKQETGLSPREYKSLHFG